MACIHPSSMYDHNSIPHGQVFKRFLLLSQSTSPLTDHLSHFDHTPGEGNGNPLQCSCLENPTDRGVWRGASVGSHRVGHDWSDLAAAAHPIQLRPHSSSVLPLSGPPWFSMQRMFFCFHLTLFLGQNLTLTDISWNTLFLTYPYIFLVNISIFLLYLF